MDFVTLHEFSMQFDVPVRVLRYRLRQLLQAGKLVDGQDYRRDDFVDDTHFVWKLNPASFARVAGLQAVTKSVSEAPPTVTDVVNAPLPKGAVQSSPPGQTLPKLDTNSPGLEREMIDLLKDQMRVKDTQICDLTGQAKTLTALNEKLTGVMVHQSEQIRNLLRLTGGKSELNELATKPGNDGSAEDANLGINEVGHGKPPGNHTASRAA